MQITRNPQSSRLPLVANRQRHAGMDPVTFMADACYFRCAARAPRGDAVLAGSRRTKRNVRRLNAARRNCQHRTAAQCDRRQPEEIERWLTNNYARLVRFAACSAYPEAQDAVHEAWLRAQSRFDPQQGKFPPFFWGVLRNVLAELNRQNSRRSARETFLEEGTVEPSAEEDFSARDDRACARAVLDLLPPDLLQPLVLHLVAGMPIIEIARALNISLGAAKMRLMRSRDRLAGILRDAGCHSVSDALKLGDLALRRPVVLTPPRPARRRAMCLPRL